MSQRSLTIASSSFAISLAVVVATAITAAEYKAASSSVASQQSKADSAWAAELKLARAISKESPATIASRIDKLLADDVATTGAGKSAQKVHRASDDVFLRRVYLDLLGRNPTPAEITSYSLDPDADKRAKVVDRLLDDPQFGENWAHYWRDVIVYRRSDDRGQIAGPPLYDYLREQLNGNKPWDEIARSFITATGDVREKGETAIMMAQFGNTADITAEVSRIFLGIQIQCAQCHDHKTDQWKRTQFHELAAFFPRVAVLPRNTDTKRTFEVVGKDSSPRFRPKANNDRKGNPEHFMPDLDRPEARGTRMEPVFFLTGQKLEPGKTDAERRESIGRWITAPDNEWFAKAFVNRLWAELVGAGFYEPIDDLGPERDCTAPKTIGLLAASFAADGFNIKRLYRIILATDAYQRESRSRSLPADAPFAANCPQRLRGDQLYDALVAALGINDNSGRLGARLGLNQGPLRGPRNQFNQVFGYDPSTPRDEITGSIPQALMLMNGQQINQAISGTRRNSDLAKLLASTSDNEAVATELYLRCLGREPNKAELKTCLTQVKNGKSRAEAFEDILWALVNSTEFLHRK